MRRVQLVVVLIFGVGCTQTSTDSASKNTSETPSSEATITTTPPTTTTPEPIPKTKVPKLEGLQLEKAQKLVARADLEVSYEEKYSHEPAGRIIAQRPSAGERVEEGTTLELVIAKAFPIVPNVVGLSLTQAERALRHAGFELRIIKSGSSGTPGTVITQNRAAGSEALPGVKVSITIPNCTSGYSPYLTPASDYDCAGGSGDGPKYTGLVRVTGSDPYGLDADNDGYGCE
jgi:resuscitation-promoting factor RpfB